MAQRLEYTPADDFYDVAWTATERRDRYEYTTAVLADTPAAAARALHAAARGEQPPAGAAAVRAATGNGPVFAFSGNGSQWPGMATALLRDEPVFRSAVDAVDAALAPLLGWSVIHELERPADRSRLHLTEIAQPLLFAVQIGQVRLLESHGVRPVAVVGHSVGEIAAAHVCGALDLPAACQAVAARSRAQAPTAGQGRMAAVGLPADEMSKELAAYAGRLELAGVNSPQDCTIAGDATALTALGAELATRGVFFRELDLDYAFHSRAMDPIEEPLRAALSRLRPRPPRAPFVPTVTGGPAPGPRLDAAYWWHNVRRPVLFDQAVASLRDAGHDLFLSLVPPAALRPPPFASPPPPVPPPLPLLSLRP
ncbi:acyltransferase domain-containing protein, partial [Streptomyces specialis]|uniref:acyltransferase domain-containing protein n=1 Tax=Streptomyces specialis TaxID=498367 RepID=UPI000AC5F35A